MLSRTVKRACIESRWTTLPTFLVPAFAMLSTSAAPTIEARPIQPKVHIPTVSTPSTSTRPSARSSNIAAPTTAIPHVSSATSIKPRAVDSSIRELLPLLVAQHAHYITAHIHGRPYLLTEGDTVRLPFKMPNVNPGDILRLNCAVNIGSRDFTLKAPASVDNSMLSPTHADIDQDSHFVYNRMAGKINYVDDRLFVCRAVVAGTESEPMRFKEKTKRRQRKVKTAKSKHRFTILKIKELRIKTIEELDAQDHSTASPADVEQQ